MIAIERLSPRRIRPYLDFLSRHGGALLYYTPKYQQFLTELLNCGEHYLVATEDGAVRGVLPLLYTESVAGRVYNALPYFGSHGGIIAECDAAYESLLSAYNRIATDPETLAATMVENPFAHRRLSDVAHSHVDFRIGQSTPLPESGDAQSKILAQCEPSTRRNVKKAIAYGINVDVGSAYLEPLQSIHEQNMRAIGGTAKSAKFFQMVPDMFTEHDDYTVYASLLDGRIVAAVLLFYFGRTVEYYTPAVAEEFRSLQPLSLALITAMSDAARRGYRRWNWGGTWPTQTGVYRFKRKWGAVEKRYHYYTQVNDESLLERTPSQLLSEFPNFFTVPFNALKRGAA